jgi:hypothetical protein
VANTLNLVSKRVIFQELHATNGDIIQFIPFVCAFYAFEYPLFYSHCICENDVTIIPWEPIEVILGGGTLFTLAHFKVLIFYN